MVTRTVRDKTNIPVHNRTGPSFICHIGNNDVGCVSGAIELTEIAKSRERKKEKKRKMGGVAYPEEVVDSII